MKKPVKHILSYGGGVNTVALMLLLIKGKKPLDEVVFADTGAEVPETYAYLKTAKEYLHDHDIPFRTVSKRIEGRDLYKTCWHRKVFPSVLWRWSTRDFKVDPIYKYYRSLDSHVNQYLGIAYDEFERMKDSKVDYVTNLFPLVQKKMTRDACIDLIEKEGLPVPVKSGCFFCPFNSLDRWEWLYEKHPRLYQKAVALEENSKHFPMQRLTDQVYRNRAKVTLRELREALKTGSVENLRTELPCEGFCMT